MINYIDLWTILNIGTLLLCGITAIACAIIAHKVFSRYSSSKAAKFKKSGYIILAIALGVVNITSRVVTTAPREWQLGVNFVSLVMTLVALLCLFYGMWDLYKHQPPVYKR